VARYGAQYGPDVTFLGIERCELGEPSSYADADVVVVGAPFDGGTSHRPGARFGPQAIRTTDYLPHDGSRPSLALRTDGPRDLVVRDDGDVEMPPGEIERSLAALQLAVGQAAAAEAVPVVLGGDHGRPNHTASHAPSRRERTLISSELFLRGLVTSLGGELERSLEAQPLPVEPADALAVSGLEPLHPIPSTG